MKTVSRLVAAGALLGLTGCGIFGDTFHVDGFVDRGAPEGTDFNTCLAREYYFLTQAEAKIDGRDGDYFHASRYMRRSKAALAGEEVSPWMASDWNVAPESVAELDEGRERLIAAMAVGKDLRPCECARAQAHYDAWLEQENDNDLGDQHGHRLKGFVQPDNVTAEKFRFNRYVQRCLGQTETAEFVVYFGFNKSNLTADAMNVIDEVATFVAKLSGPTVTVTGHTDTSGSMAYNQRLSERRAAAVAKALAEKGVGNIVTNAKGESEPAVPTGDGVKEPLNRRATIAVE